MVTVAQPPPKPAAKSPARPKPRPSSFVHLSRVHALQASGNAAIAVALANSLFFSIDPTAARSSIISYLLLSVAPFVLVAPMIGPAIDKIRSGHKVVLISLLFAMTLTSFGMIGRMQTFFVFPLAFAVLVFGKGYAVAKAAIMPMIVRSNDELVPKNSRLAVLTGVMSFVGAIPAALASIVGGASWTVGLAMIQFLFAALIAFKLPSSRRFGRNLADSRFGDLFGNSDASQPAADLLADWDFLRSDGGDPPSAQPVGPMPPVEAIHTASAVPSADTPIVAPPPSAPPAPRSWPSRLTGVFRLWQRATQNPSLKLPSIKNSALAMLMLRAFVGFVTFFLAFHFRGGTDDVDLSGVGTAVGAGVSNLIGFDVNSQGAEPIWKLGVLVAFGVTGGLIGSFLAPKLRRANQESQILIGSLLFVLVASLGSWFIGGLWGGMLIAFAVGFSGGAGKVAFDSIVQRDAGDQDYGRSFAIFETRFQLAWVIGALLPVLFKIPFALGCILLIVAAAVELVIFFVRSRDKSTANLSSYKIPNYQPQG